MPAKFHFFQQFYNYIIQYSVLALCGESSIPSSLKRASLTFRAFFGLRRTEVNTSFCILGLQPTFVAQIEFEDSLVTPHRNSRSSAVGKLACPQVCSHSRPPQQNAPSRCQSSSSLTNHQGGGIRMANSHLLPR